MFSAKTYFLNHSLQVRGIDALLQKFKPKMKWTDQHKIMDIGCGPGDITHNFLLPLIRTDGELMGIDICKPMIEIARTEYRNSRSNYEVMDITKSEVSEKYPLYFDSVFSFYCMNWFQDQRYEIYLTRKLLVLANFKSNEIWMFEKSVFKKPANQNFKNAMKNIYSILKPGGETLFILVVNTVVYPLFEILAASPIWSSYMLNYRNSISPYRNSSDPVSDVRNLMQNIGFQVEECYFEIHFHTFPSKQIFFKWMDGINPFRNNIPAHLLKEFDEECQKIALRENLCTVNITTNEATMNYTTVTCFARKSHQVNFPSS